MRSLRILTGYHAGAQLVLTARHQRIGSDDDADIQITDWQHPSVALETGEANEAITLMTLDKSDLAAAATPLVAMSDFMPQRFGDVVLCIGPADAPWPSDFALLERLMQPGAPTRWRGSPGLLIAGGAIAAALTTFGVIASGSAQPATAARARGAEPLAVRVEAALAAVGAKGLTVRPTERGVEVEGMVADPGAAGRVRAALRPFDADTVTHRYGTATDVARAISDAAGSSGVRVDYPGDGVFVVSGHTADLGRLRDTVQRVRVDLGARVARIEVVATEDAAPGRSRATAVLAAGGIQYVEAANGTKYFSVVTQAPDGEPQAAVPPTPLSTYDRRP